eukprot:gene15528-20962_t
MEDPYLRLAKAFSGRYMLRILFFVIVCGVIVDLILSGLSLSNNPGDVTTYNSKGEAQSWHTFCTTQPIKYLSPFYFYLEYGSLTSSSPSYCGWPISLTAFRMVISGLIFILLPILTIKTGISSFGRPILLLYSLLFFIAFVLDTNALVQGTQVCQSGFKNILGFPSSYSFKCYVSHYVGLPIVDIGIAFLLFLAQSSWSLTDDFYGANQAAMSTQDENNKV